MRQQPLASPRACRRIRWGAAAAAVVLGLGLAVSVGSMALHLHAAPVLSASMKPDFSPGDLVITRSVPSSSVRPGMVVEFQPPGEDVSFAHRVVTVSHQGSHPVITTKGDANTAADPWHARLDQTTVPRVVTSIPRFGYVVNDLHSRDLRLALVAVVGLLLTAVAAITAHGSGGRRQHPATT
jgi:signal peptidase I